MHVYMIIYDLFNYKTKMYKKFFGDSYNCLQESFDDILKFLFYTQNFRFCKS